MSDIGKAWPKLSSNKEAGIPLDIARRVVLVLTAIAAPFTYAVYRACENVVNKSAFFDDLPPNYIEVHRARGYFGEIRDIAIGAVLCAAAASYMGISGGWGLLVGAFLGYEYPPLEVVTRVAARVVQVAAGTINGLLLGCNESVYRI